MLAQSERNGVGTRYRRALDGCQRARRTWQRSRARLPRFGNGGRVLRLALKLLWSARGSSSHPAEARLGGQSDQTRVRPRQPYSFAWTRILYGHYFAGAIQTWRFHRPTRVMEPHTRSGHKVIFVPFSDGRPSGLLVDVLAGFVSVDGAWASGGDRCRSPPGCR
jgi:hypothetical protein